MFSELMVLEQERVKRKEKQNMTSTSVMKWMITPSTLKMVEKYLFLGTLSNRV